MATHVLQVREVVRWLGFNEYEGEVRGVLDGVPVTCHVLVSPVEQWGSFRAGVTMEVDAWLERSGPVETLPPGIALELVQVDGVVYDLTGLITQWDGELLGVESVLPMRIDLDLTVGTDVPSLQIGHIVRVRGVLKVDLPDPAPAARPRP